MDRCLVHQDFGRNRLRCLPLGHGSTTLPHRSWLQTDGQKYDIDMLEYCHDNDLRLGGVMPDSLTQFGPILRAKREAAGMSRHALAGIVGMDASHIYRIEMGGRRPSRESALALAEALGIKDDALNSWLVAAGFAPTPLLGMVRGAVRTRGGARSPAVRGTASPAWDSARWARWLEAMGLQESMIARVMQALERKTQVESLEVARAISAAFSRVAQTLEAPVRKAVIPAAGADHQLVAPHVMQRLLLRSIGEAVESGIADILLILAPGQAALLHAPLKEALAMSVAPVIHLECARQPEPAGLGDAVLLAEEFVGAEPFAVLLPDDVMRARIGRGPYPQSLRRMMDALIRVTGAHLIAVASVKKSKKTRCGVARLGRSETHPDILPILQLVEKPKRSHPLVRARNSYGIVGRYLLQPTVFAALRKLKSAGPARLELTDALEALRREGEIICAIELSGKRDDVGEALTRAGDLIGR